MKAAKELTDFKKAANYMHASEYGKELDNEWQEPGAGYLLFRTDTMYWPSMTSERNFVGNIFHNWTEQNIK